MSKITDENNIKENYMNMLDAIYESLKENRKKRKNNKVIKFNFKKGFKISNGLIYDFEIPFKQIVEEYFNYKLPKKKHDKMYDKFIEDNDDTEKNKIIDNYCIKKIKKKELESEEKLDKIKIEEIKNELRESFNDKKIKNIILKYISDNYKADFKRKILSHIKSVFKQIFKSDPLYLVGDDNTSSFECRNVSENKLKKFLLNYVKIYLICDNCKNRKISFIKNNRSLEFYCNNCKSTFYGSNLIKKFKVQIQC